MNAVARRVAGRDHELTGTVRLSTTYNLAFGFLPRRLAAFHSAYRRIRIDLVSTAQGHRRVSKQEADVAFQTDPSPDSDMVGRRICRLAVALYGSRTYLAGRSWPRTPDDLADHSVIASDESLDHFAIGQWQRKHVPGEAIVYTTNSLLTQFAAVRSGLGLSVLPCYLAEREPEVVRLFPPDQALGVDLWLVTHGELRRTARIRAFVDFMTESILKDLDTLEGRADTDT